MKARSRTTISPRVDARVDQLAQALGERSAPRRSRLGGEASSPVDSRLAAGLVVLLGVPAVAGGEQQLDRGPAPAGARPAAGRRRAAAEARRAARSPSALTAAITAGRRAEVAAQRQQLAVGGSPLGRRAPLRGRPRGRRGGSRRSTGTRRRPTNSSRLGPAQRLDQPQLERGWCPGTRRPSGGSKRSR